MHSMPFSIKMVSGSPWYERKGDVMSTQPLRYTIQDLTGGPNIYQTPCPEPLFKRSYISESVLAHEIADKYCLGIPYNRSQFERNRLNVPYTGDDLSRWTINLYEKKFIYLMPLLWDSLITNDEQIIQADETTFLVLRIDGKEPGSRSYIWSYNTCKTAEHPIHLYAFEMGRSGDFPASRLMEFVGYLVTDAYPGYNKVARVIHVLCWIHARRKFVEALPTDRSLLVLSKQFNAIQKIDEMFKQEAKLQNLDAATRLEERDLIIRPLVKCFYDWLDLIEPTIVPKTKLAQAVSYCKKYRNELFAFLDNGNLPMHNQVSELSMRNIAIGRKNFLFYGSPRGANAGTCMYSLVETAVANHLDPELYLNFLMENMKGENFEKSRDHLETLLPWADMPQKKCLQSCPSDRRQKSPKPLQPVL